MGEKEEMTLEEVAFLVENIIAPLLWVCVGIYIVKIILDVRREVRKENEESRKLRKRLEARLENGN